MAFVKKADASRQQTALQLNHAQYAIEVQQRRIMTIADEIQASNVSKLEPVRAG